MAGSIFKYQLSSCKNDWIAISIDSYSGMILCSRSRQSLPKFGTPSKMTEVTQSLVQVW